VKYDDPYCFHPLPNTVLILIRVGGQLLTGFWRENLTERDHLEDPYADVRQILEFIFKQSDGGTGWIDLAEDRDRWQAHLNLWISLNAGNLLTR
jgi:hypothetical protein